MAHNLTNGFAFIFRTIILYSNQVLLRTFRVKTKPIFKMKKNILIVATLMLALITTFSSCKKDSTPPTIQFTAGSGYTSSDVTVPVSSTIKVGITAKSGSSKLTDFKIVANASTSPTTILDSTFSSDTFSRDFTITAPAEAGTASLSFIVTDQDNQTAEVSFVITTTAKPISEYTQVMLGSYNNSAYGSSFASADGTVYMLADAKANASKVDWLYYYGSVNAATLAAPADADAATVFNSASNGLQTWPVLNATRFRAVTEGAVWDNILNAADIEAIAVNTNKTSVNQLSVGDILAFKTAAGKLGLIKIDAITTGAAGTITYTVKVQQ